MNKNVTLEYIDWLSPGFNPKNKRVEEFYDPDTLQEKMIRN